MFITLVIGFTSLFSVQLFHQHLKATLTQQTAAQLGGDLRIKSPQALPKSWLKNYPHSHVIQLTTVVWHRGTTQMLTLHAFDDAYPCKGQWITDPESHTRPNQALWIQAPLPSLLQLKTGDTLNIAGQTLPIAGIVKAAPDHPPFSLNLAPSVWMTQDTLKSLDLLKPGSRANHLYYVHCQKSCEPLIQTFRQQRSPGQSLITPKSRSNRINNSLEQGYRLGTLLSTLSALASFLSLLYLAHHWLHAQRDNLTILGILGAKPHQLLMAIIVTWLGLLTSSALLSTLLAGMLQYGMHALLKPWLNLTHTTWIPADIVWIMAFVLLAILSVIAAPAYQHVYPRQVCHRHTIDGSCLMMLLISLLFYSKQPAFVLGFIVILLGILGLLYRVWHALIQWHHTHCQPKQARDYLAQAHIYFDRRLYAGVLTICTCLITCIVMASSASFAIISHWKQQSQDITANYFALNLSQKDSMTLQSWLNQQKIRHSSFYPMSRGRLMEKNNQPILKTLNTTQKRFNVLHRPLNISYTTQLPANNILVSGTWPPAPHEWSIEESLAKTLDLNIGDTLGFLMQGEKITGVISSIRRLSWADIQPNFYVIGHETPLASLPQDWLGSFFIEKNQQLKSIIDVLPSINLIDVTRVIRIVEEALHSLSTLLSGFASITILSCAILVQCVYLNQRPHWQHLQHQIAYLGYPMEHFERFLGGLLLGGVLILSSLLADIILMVLHQSLWMSYHTFHQTCAIISLVGVLLIINTLRTQNNPHEKT